ncbi:UNVERIFIED_CONTAM: hypothetical protein FKN15_072570 [Acipenser sinensis]
MQLSLRSERGPEWMLLQGPVQREQQLRKEKLTDFGLAKLMSSVSSVSRESQGGTISYMPPEAIEDVNYKPTPAYDVFSFGILLWSLITGEKPYSHAKSSLIKWHIPRGQRPDISHIDSTAVEKLGDIVELMQSCWDRDQNNRPLFSSEQLFKELYT